jgi:hypothetical protein
MQAFHAESGFVLNTVVATGGSRKLLSHDALGAIWLSNDQAIPQGYVVLTFRFSMELGGLEAIVDDLCVRPDARVAAWEKRS